MKRSYLLSRYKVLFLLIQNKIFKTGLNSIFDKIKKDWRDQVSQ